MRNENIIDEHEIKEIQYLILKSVDEFCKKQQLTYMLCYGTLLGAVRHKGFIPWDDDIDIMMPRTDYETFIMNYSHCDYEVLSCETNVGYKYPFAKVCDKKTIISENVADSSSIEMGLNIDVFPIDGLPNSYILRKFRLLSNRIMRYIYICIAVDTGIGYSRLKNYFAKFLKKCMIKVDGNVIARKFNKHVMKDKYDTSRYIACQTWGYLDKEIMEKDKIEPCTEVFFCEKTFKAPRDTNYYLSRLYGNYMKLPPEEERQSHHDFKAYRKVDVDEGTNHN